METEPARMTAAEASALIQSRKMSCEELVRSCLGRIASARRRGESVAVAGSGLRHPPSPRTGQIARRKGRCTALPWGVKDVIDTADYPTTQNSPIYDGFRGRPRRRSASRWCAVRRVDPGQDRYRRVRLVRPQGADPEPIQSGAYAGRLLVRLGRRGGRFPGAIGASARRPAART